MATLSFLFLYVLPALGGWKVFEKAGVAGWVALIPVLNLFGLLRLLGRSYLWILAFVFAAPVAHVVAAILVAWRFGRSTLFGVGLAVLPFVFVPVLGFGDARYLQPAR
jgi:hypothetical protein